MGVRIKLRRDILQTWFNTNPVLADGEIGFVKSNLQYIFKIGDGLTAWNALPTLSFVKKISIVGNTAPAINTQIIVPHGLGYVPFGLALELYVRTAANGYVVDANVTPAVANASLSYDINNCYIATAGALPTVVPALGGAAVAIVATNYRWLIRGVS